MLVQMSTSPAGLNLRQHLIDVTGGCAQPTQLVERITGRPIVGERPLDRQPHPRAGGQLATLGGLADPTVEGLGDQDLEPDTQMRILT